MGRKYNSKKVIRRDKNCVYCGTKYDGTPDSTLTVDHVIPRSRYSEYNLSFRQVHCYSNLVAACRKCNRHKSDKSIEDFLDEDPQRRKNFIHRARYINNGIKELLAIDKRY